jgi:NADH:ubiquinone oxidoreductase subunit 3 (subunit A)
VAETVLGKYVPILIMFALALLIVGVSINIHKLIAPRGRRGTSITQLATYESGEVPIGNARGPIDVQYYLYVIVFLIIDIEAVFLIPWAIKFLALGPAAIVEMVIFVGLVLLGWAYAWKKGALQWQS